MNIASMNDCNVGRSPGLHTGMNLFVCNMALSDIMMSLTAAPLTPLTRYTKLSRAVNNLREVSQCPEKAFIHGIIDMKLRRLSTKIIINRWFG